jgi:hypothetical protein
MSGRKASCVSRVSAGTDLGMQAAARVLPSRAVPALLEPVTTTQ